MSTGFTESFNKADSTTLGPDQAWTEVNDDTDIVSNAAHAVTITGALLTTARCNTDIGATNHYAQAAVTTLTNGGSGTPDFGVCCRFAAAANTFYTLNVYKNTASPNGHWQLESVAAGVETVIQQADYTWAANDVVYLSCVGTTITARINGAVVASVTNSTITTGTQVGIVGYRNVPGDDARLDNFQAGTFPGIPVRPRRSTRAMMTR